MIEVSRKDNPNAPKIILKPNEKLILNKQLLRTDETDAAVSQGSTEKQVARDFSVTSIPKNIPDSNKAETAWVFNRLVFEGDNFQSLASKMERWYNVKIQFADMELMHYRFKGAFANETIAEALDALQLTADFQYKINGNDIILSRK